jgi:hypothetical protein
MLHTHEVTGSSPVVSTKKKPIHSDGFLFVENQTQDETPSKYGIVCLSILANIVSAYILIEVLFG